MSPRTTLRILVVVMLPILTSPLEAQKGKIHRADERVPNEYIVTLYDNLHNDLDKIAEEIGRAYEGQVFRTYRKAFKGFAIRLPESRALRLAQNPLVRTVEENAIGHLSSTYDSTTIKEWHLDRIDGNGLNDKYYYCDDTEVNATVVVYVFDTGMRRTHDEFQWENPPISGISCTGYSPPCPAASTNGYNKVTQTDGYGATDIDGNCQFGYHGQAVASIIAGRNVGVAQAAYVWPVRVGECDGDLFLADVLDGIDTVLDERTGNSPGVANFSFFFRSTSTTFPSLSSALQSMKDDGIVVVASANNQDQDRCSEQYPAGYAHVITVGATFGGTSTLATDSMDSRVTGVKDAWASGSGVYGSGSNYGSCVDIFAPGFDIRHALAGSDNDYEDPPREDSAATSYAAAIVSGVAARYLAEYPSASVSDVENHILSTATASVDLECDLEQDDFDETGSPFENYNSCTSTTTKLVRVSRECD